MAMKFVSLPEIAIIGKEGHCTKNHNVVSELWAAANAHFNEVAELGRKEPDGSYVGFWGAMSDVSMRFNPWEDDFSTGMYLAGIEVYLDSEAPEGWTKWVMPARTYLVVDVVPERYGEIFTDTIQRILPENNLKLAGAVCDFTESATGNNKLFFPVDNLGIDCLGVKTYNRKGLGERS